MLEDQIQSLHIFSNPFNTLQASCEGLGKAIYRMLDSNGVYGVPRMGNYNRGAIFVGTRVRPLGQQGL